MNKTLLGTVNAYGKEALEKCYGKRSKTRVVFEPKDTIRAKQGTSQLVIWGSKIVTWSAWLVDNVDYGPKSQKDYNPNNREYTGD